MKTFVAFDLDEIGQIMAEKVRADGFTPKSESVAELIVNTPSDFTSQTNLLSYGKQMLSTAQLPTKISLRSGS